MLLKTYISAQLILAAWAATVPTPTVSGIFNFTSLIDMVVNISNPTASPSSVSEIKPEQTCRLQEIAGCFSTTAPRFYTAVINIYRRDTRISICGIADDFNTCAVPYKRNCSSADTLSFDIFTGLIQYLCTEQGYNDYQSLVPCVSNPKVTTEINKCVDNFPSPLQWDDLCRLPDNYTSCVITATRGYCEGTSANMLRQTLMTILYPLKIATCQNKRSSADNTQSQVEAKEVPVNFSTTASQSQSDEFSTISPDFTTQLTYASSTTELDFQAPVEPSIIVDPNVSKSYLFSEDSSKAVLNIDTSSQEMSVTPSYITPELSLVYTTTEAPYTSTFIESSETVTAYATEVQTGGFSIQSAIVVKQQEPSVEPELLTRATDKEQPDTLTTLGDAATITLPSQQLSMMVLVDSVTPTSLQDRTTSSREFSTITSGISPSIVSIEELPTTLFEGEFSTSILENTGVHSSLVAFSETPLGDWSVQKSLGELSSTSLEVTAGQASLVPEVLSSVESVGTVLVSSIEVATIEASTVSFSTAPLQVTAVHTALGELSTAPFEATTVQGSQGELSTATLEATPSELSSDNLRTELPRVSISQKLSDEVSTSLLQTPSGQTLLEKRQETATSFPASSLVTEDGTVSVIIPQATQLLSSLDEFASVGTDNGAFELSTKSFSASFLDTTVPEISEQFSTVELNIKTSQVTIENIPAQTADVTISETPISRFATVVSHIGTPGDSSVESVTETASLAVTPVTSGQFSTVAPAILTSRMLSDDFSSTVVARIYSQESSSVVPDTGITVISSEIFPTVTYDFGTIKASAAATQVELTSETEIPTISLSGTKPYSEIKTTSLDLSASATQINTINNDRTTIPTTELSTLGQVISTNLLTEVSPISSEYISRAQDQITTVTGGTTIEQRLENLPTTLIQYSSTEYTSLVEGTSIIPVQGLTISPLYFDTSSISTQELQISPTSVGNLPTTTVYVPTTQTSSPKTTATTSATTSAPTTTATSTSGTTPSPPTTTVASTTPVDFKTSPVNCYECHSGAPGSWQNVNCPPDGRIQNWAATPKLCHGPCVSMVSKYPAGDVYRACSTNYYFPAVPPRDGCTRQDQGLFCFCSTHFCNTRDMTKEQQEYIKGANPSF